MKTFIVNVLEFILTVVFIALLAISGLYGYANEVATSQLILNFGVVPPPEINIRIIGAAIGVVTSFIICSILFGFLFVLLDIRDQLAKQNELLKK